MKPIIVVATNEEYKLAKERFKGHKIIQTGVGGINVYETLKHVPRWRKIVNFGYAGSNNIPKGTEVNIGVSVAYHPKVEYLEPVYLLNEESDCLWSLWCYTAGDFVTETEIKEPCVFDMELAYIMAMGFKHVKSIKIISDNLSLKQYEEEIK